MIFLLQMQRYQACDDIVILSVILNQHVIGLRVQETSDTNETQKNVSKTTQFTKYE